jgi:glutaredoxin
LVHLHPSLGFHGDGDWALGLAGFYRASRTVGSKCFRKSCTDNLKIKPIYRYLADRLARDYGLPVGGRWRTKQPLVEFAQQYGRVRVLIGFAKGEETRVSGDDALPPWMRHTVSRVFPLIELGLDRAACVESMRARGLPVPPPSLCQRCPYKSEIELLWTYIHLPAVYADWVELEAAKLEKFAHKGKDNFGVFGRRTLPEVLADATRKYGHMTNEEIEQYRMSHGRQCVLIRRPGRGTDRAGELHERSFFAAAY